MTLIDNYVILYFILLIIIILIIVLVLQSLNQRPGQPMTMQGMQSKIPGMGMMPTQTSGPMNHMGPIQTMQANSMLTQMNSMGQGNIPQQMTQMVPNQMAQITTGQMQQNMQVCIYYCKKACISSFWTKGGHK